MKLDPTKPQPLDGADVPLHVSTQRMHASKGDEPRNLLQLPSKMQNGFGLGGTGDDGKHYGEVHPVSLHGVEQRRIGPFDSCLGGAGRFQRADGFGGNFLWERMGVKINEHVRFLLI